MIKINTPFTQLDAKNSFTLGTTVYDEKGNEFIYLKGVSSTGTGYLVSYDEAYSTTLADNDTGSTLIGSMALAMGPCIGSGTATYGWYQIMGKGTAYAASSISDNTRLQATATAGAVDDTTSGTCVIVGLWAREAAAGAGSLFKVELEYPCVVDVTLS